jgi:hypothetical protein
MRSPTLLSPPPYFDIALDYHLPHKPPGMAHKRDAFQIYERRISQHQRQLDATKIQLNGALQKIDDMQV